MNDNRTENRGYKLPHPDNFLEEDALRLAEALAAVDADVASLDSGKAPIANPQFQGTGALRLPAGTTAQRPANPLPGMTRFNTDFQASETYSANTGWTQEYSAPFIDTITPTLLTGNAGQVVTLFGKGFQPGMTVDLIDNASVVIPAPSVSFISTGQATFTIPQNLTVAREPYSVRITLPNGQTHTRFGVLDGGNAPSWVSLGTIADKRDRYDSYAPIATLQATDPEGQVVTYSVETANLPGGVTLNSATGALSGDPTDLAAGVGSTTFTFGATATDALGNSSSRSLSILVRKTFDGTNADRAADSGLAILGVYPGAPNGTYFLRNGAGTALQVFCDMTGAVTGFPGAMRIDSALLGASSAIANGDFATAFTGVDQTGWISQAAGTFRLGGSNAFSGLRVTLPSTMAFNRWIGGSYSLTPANSPDDAYSWDNTTARTAILNRTLASANTGGYCAAVHDLVSEQNVRFLKLGNEHGSSASGVKTGTLLSGTSAGALRHITFATSDTEGTSTTRESMTWTAFTFWVI